MHVNSKTTRRQFLKKTVQGALIAGAGLRALAFDSASQRSSDATRNVANTHAILLDGNVVDWVSSVEGGQAIARDKTGSEAIPKTQIAGLKYTDIRANCGPAMSKDFYEWIKATFDGRNIRKNGAVLDYDYNYHEVSRLVWTNGLITEVQGELQGISGDARTLLANLNSVTGQTNQQKIRVLLDNVNAMLATERPKIDRLTDQLNALSQHADETIQNVNGTVSDVREPVRKDLTELQNTLLEAKQLLSGMQVLVRANDYKIDDTIENLRTATENLDQLTESVKQRPWSLIRVKQPEDRKVPK